MEDRLQELLRDSSGQLHSIHESASINTVFFINGKPIVYHHPDYLRKLGQRKAGGARTCVAFKFGRFTPPVIMLKHGYYFNNTLYSHSETHIQLHKVPASPTQLQIPHPDQLHCSTS